MSAKKMVFFSPFFPKKYSKNQNFEIIAVCDIAIVILNLKPLYFSVSDGPYPKFHQRDRPIHEAKCRLEEYA